MITKIGLDLGYANVTLSDVTSGLYREPSIALMDRKTRRILAVGSAAVAGAEGANGGDTVLVRPFKNGLLYSADVTSGVIRAALGTLHKEEHIRLTLGVPATILPKQESALFDMLHEAGVSEAYAVNRAYAALIGAGISPDASAVSVNIGAETTEILVLYHGRTLLLASEKVGGEDFDKAVRKYIADVGEVNVSLSVAESIKEKLGAVWEGKQSESLDIEGTLALTGNHVKMTITTEDILGVFEAPLQALLSAIAEAVKKIPLDYVEELFKTGIVLTGGGAELFGLECMVEKVLGIRTVKPRQPIDAVALGLSRINGFLPVRMGRKDRDITDEIAKYYENKKQPTDNG